MATTTITTLALCNQALVLLGAGEISSLSETTVAATTAARLYPMARDAALSDHPWNFATRRVRLMRLSAISGEVLSRRYAYALPDDCLRPLHGDPGAAYAVLAGRLETNGSSFALTYVARVEESVFPPSFAEALTLRLATLFCLPLTENASRTEALAVLAEVSMRRARLVDAQQDTPAAISGYALIEERG